MLVQALNQLLNIVPQWRPSQQINLSIPILRSRILCPNLWTIFLCAPNRLIAPLHDITHNRNWHTTTNSSPLTGTIPKITTPELWRKVTINNTLKLLLIKTSPFTKTWPNCLITITNAQKAPKEWPWPNTGQIYEIYAIDIKEPLPVYRALPLRIHHHHQYLEDTR